MARKIYKQSELSRKSKAELKKIQKVQRDMALRNIRNLQKAGVTMTPAIQRLQSSIEQGTVKPIKNITATSKTKLPDTKENIIKSITEYQLYNISPTGTLSGYKKSTTPKFQYVYKNLATMKNDELKMLRDKMRKETVSKVKKLLQSGYKDSPALLGLEKSIENGVVPAIKGIGAKGKSVEGKPRYKYIGEILAYQRFTNAKTSTPTGMANTEFMTDLRLGDAYANATAAQKRRFWELYEEQRMFIDDNMLDSDRILTKFTEQFFKGDKNSLADIVNQAYDEKATEQGDNTGFWW